MSDVNYHGRHTLVPAVGDQFQLAMCPASIQLTHRTKTGGVLYRIVIPSIPH